MLTVVQVQAVSSPSENSEFSRVFIFSAVFINSADRKCSALIVAPRRIYLIQMPDLKLTLTTNIHSIKLYSCFVICLFVLFFYTNLIKRVGNFSEVAFSSELRCVPGRPNGLCCVPRPF